jgi:hypothetical protein
MSIIQQGEYCKIGDKVTFKWGNGNICKGTIAGFKTQINVLIIQNMVDTHTGIKYSQCEVDVDDVITNLEESDDVNNSISEVKVALHIGTCELAMRVFWKW